jgi:hypothetical protein
MPPRNRKHCGSDLDVTKDGILSGNDQIARECKLKTAAQRKAPAPPRAWALAALLGLGKTDLTQR